MLHAFGTHQPLLFGACLSTDGPLIELGTGFYSTPFIHAVSAAQGRPAWSVDTSRAYLTFMGQYESDAHRMMLLDEEMMMGDDGKIVFSDDQSPAYFVERQTAFLERHFGSITPGVVFVDHDPAFLRQPAIEWFADRADFIVTHDTESPEHYGFDFTPFRSRLSDHYQPTGTVVVSNRRDCEALRQFLWARGSGKPILEPTSAKLVSHGQWASVHYPVHSLRPDGLATIVVDQVPDGDLQIVARSAAKPALGMLWRQILKDGQPHVPCENGRLLVEASGMWTVGNLSPVDVDEVEFRFRADSGEIVFEVS